MRNRLSRLQKLVRFGNLSPAIEVDNADSALGRLRKLQSEMKRLTTEFHQKFETIYSNENLSGVGRQRAAKEIGLAALRELHEAAGRLSYPAKQRRADLERAFQKMEGRPTDPAEAARQEVQAREIRDALLAMDSSTRWSELQRAVNEDDNQTVAAVLSSPPLIRRKLIDDRILAALRGEWRRRRDPQAASELRALELASAGVEWDLRELHAGIAAAAGFDQASTRERVTGETRRKAEGFARDGDTEYEKLAREAVALSDAVQED